MKGRVLSIKKTTILRLSFIVNFLLFLLLSFLSIYNGQKDYFFFIFCVLLGGHLLIKSVLFKLDSSCFFGCVLFFLGCFYFYCQAFALELFFIVFLLIAFSTSCLFTHTFFEGSILLPIAISTYFASIFTFLFIIKSISLIFFLAFLGAIMLLLGIKIFVVK